MAIKSPARLEPLDIEDLPDWMQTGGQNIVRVNVMRTIAHHPDLLKPWNRFAGHVLGHTSTLSGRDREIVILRTGWNHQSDYEFGQHRIIGRREGLSDDEIDDIARWPNGGNWTEAERLLLTAADELFNQSELSDETWDGLAQHYNTQQLIDIVFAIGQYTMVCFALKTLRVQLDDGVGGLPEV